MAIKDDYYKRHLQRYFEEHYGQYKETAEWFADSAPNKWKFIVPELSIAVTLICGSNGDVSESILPRQNPKSFVYFRNKDRFMH